MYDPDTEHYAGGSVIDEGTRQWFRNLADARGIRSRAAVMRQVLATEALAATGAQEWLSLACGAAQPVFTTMQDIRDGGGAVPRVLMVDLDPDALALATTYARANGLSHVARTTRLNVLRRVGFARLPTGIPGIARPSGWIGTFDAVDAVGILEYLKPEDWLYTCTYNGIIRTTRKLAGEVTFLSHAFACVKPGGVLVVGNMRDSHPQLDFTLDVVQWPHIQPRSVDQMVTLFQRAGLRGACTVYLPSDGVYAVFVIRKPLATATAV